MNFSFKRVRALTVIQAHEFYRDFGTVFLNIIFPVMFVFAIIISSLSNPNFQFKIAVVEDSQDQATQEFVRLIASSPGMDVKTLNRQRSLQALQDGELHAVIVVANSNFGNREGQLELIVGPRYEEFSKILLDAVRDRMDRTETDTAAFSYKVSSPEQEVRSEFTFTFPGLLALAMLQLGLFATAVPLLRARDRGTLRYLSLTPLTVMEMLVGQLALRVGVALVQVTLILLAGSVMLDLSLLQWVQVFAVSALGIVLLVSIGYAIAGMAGSPQTGMSMILLANFAMLMGGNVFTDPSATTWQYVIACAIPISYLADMYRQVVSGDTGLWPIWLDVTAIIAWSVVAVLVALRTFRFDTESKKSPISKRLRSQPDAA